MGYRLRLGKIAKTEKAKYSGKSYEEVCAMFNEHDVDVTIRSPEGYKQLHEMGKDVNYRQHTINFYNFDLNKENEEEFSVMEKSGLKEIIEDYHKKIYGNYKSLLDGEDPTIFLKSRTTEWGKFLNLKPYYLDEPAENRDGFIASSWQFEYAIFNLTYIYSTFDWENDYLIYSGW